MNAEINPRPLDLVQTDPALGILRLAALSAGPDGKLDDETLDLIFERVEAGVFAAMDPAAAWPELVLGLMGRTPSNMFRALYSSGALHEVLPEVAGVFGVPQIADDPPQVDIGQHLLRVLDEAARCDAPLPVRFAALVMHAGKSDSPPEHLPVHYRHIERGRPRIEALCERFGVPGECRDLALLALAECERVHRVSQVRAGPVAALLERVGAFDRPECFEQLMILCTCDYRAYGQRPTQDYPKAALLGTALQACASIDEAGLSSGRSAAEAAESVLTARATAIAVAFRSERWSGGAE
ncbi:tRNA nucleotidyltransferase [Methylococcus sp. EFPC2]|uniref:tRNA nucleotidyltransferase n=1 Tax=Methylococcus sp. EFPC2 TaxID=2812648 RepID=UPI0019689762|nr:tRNA nucleotidyltransferase [Methylococcus sp. EFPC2]QSA96982.1 tRNA nucleotidyltransferase [Methylococcus sp. EFPC2]